jgi:hypothetical protein
MLQDNINRMATEDLARINQIVAMPRLMAGETAMMMQSFQSTQNMLNSHAAKTTTRIMKSLLSSQSELNSQTAQLIACLGQSLQSTQSILNNQVADMLRVTQEMTRTFQNLYSQIFHSLDSVRTFQRTMQSLLDDTVFGICGFLHNNDFQRLMEIQHQILNDIGLLSFHYPKIKIVDNRVWIDDEEINLEDFDETIGFDCRKIDNYIGQQWDNLPRTIRFFLQVIFQIALAYSLMVMFQNPNATHVDQQRLTEAVQEAIRSAFSEQRTLEALLDNHSYMDFPVMELAEDTLDAAGLLENEEDETEKNVMIEHTCPFISDSTQMAE